MSGQTIFRAICFVIFFGIGVTSVGLAALCNDLIEYYQNKDMLRRAEQSLIQMESLITDHEILIAGLEEDPNFYYQRVAPSAIGVEFTDPNDYYPKARAAELQAARVALMKFFDPNEYEPPIPPLLMLVSEPRRKLVLYLAGAALILLAMIFFSASTENSEPDKKLKKK